MGQALVNIGEQKLVPAPKLGHIKEIDNRGARLVEYDDAMRKWAGCSGFTQKRHLTKVVARNLSSKVVMTKLKPEECGGLARRRRVSGERAL